jgi:hypothetical protein
MTGSGSRLSAINGRGAKDRNARSSKRVASGGNADPDEAIRNPMNTTRQTPAASRVKFQAGTSQKLRVTGPVARRKSEAVRQSFQLLPGVR